MTRAAWSRLALLWAGALLVAAGPVTALMIPFSLERLEREADTIVRGRVSGQRSFWNDAGTLIVTDVILSITETVKGNAAPERTLRVRGGQVGDVGLDYSVAPTFADGEDAVVFLDTSRRPARVVGLYQGKFEVVDGAVRRRDGRQQDVAAFLGEIRRLGGDA